jgi:membrane dipeptidase
VLSETEARTLHAQALVIDAKFPGALSVPSERVQALFDAELEKHERGEIWRQAMYAKVKALAIDELWKRPEVRKAYLDLWKKSGLTAGLAVVAAVQPDGEIAFPDAVRGLASDIYTPVNTSGGKIRVATSAADIEDAHKTGGHAMIVGFENSTPIGADLGRVDFFHQFGVRSVQLTYNAQNLVGGGCTEPGASGLTRFGRALVERLNEKKIAVDVSHANDRTTLDAAKTSKAPISLNHGAARALFNHARASSDETFKAVAGTGGFVGILVVSAFLQATDAGTMDDWAEHVEHVARLIGVDNVGIGCDTGDIYQIPQKKAKFERHYPPTYPWHGFTAADRTHVTDLPGYDSMVDWPNLTVHLAKRGFNEGEIRGIIGGNYLRFFKDVVG